MERRTRNELEIVLPIPEGELVMYVRFDLMEEWEVQDHGIGQYEYFGARGRHTDWQAVCTNVELDEESVEVHSSHLFPAKWDGTYEEQDRPTRPAEVEKYLPLAVEQVKAWIKDYEPDEPSSKELEQMQYDNYEPPSGWDDPAYNDPDW